MAHPESKPLSVNLIRAIQWLGDIRSGEMVESASYRREFLGFPPIISQDDLSYITKMLNLIAQYERSPIRVDNSMGEIIPIRGLTK